MAQQVDYEAFVKRYEELKKLYFSPRSNPQYDEDGEEIPTPYMKKDQICKVFLEQMKVHIPAHRTDPPKFLEGSS